MLSSMGETSGWRNAVALNALVALAGRWVSISPRPALTNPSFPSLIASIRQGSDDWCRLGPVELTCRVAVTVDGAGPMQQLRLADKRRDAKPFLGGPAAVLKSEFPAQWFSLSHSAPWGKHSAVIAALCSMLSCVQRDPIRNEGSRAILYSLKTGQQGV